MRVSGSVGARLLLVIGILLGILVPMLAKRLFF